MWAFPRISGVLILEIPLCGVHGAGPHKLSRVSGLWSGRVQALRGP